MGLATSQVRLLALTARKADVEMQIQLNSRRKTMLTREATQLSKLYYAKLNNARFQYATSNGYNDLNYNYLMGYSNPDFVLDVANGGSNFDKKISPGMVLTDNFGRVILDDSLAQIVVKVLNSYQGNNATVEDLTMAALKLLFSDTNASPITGSNLAQRIWNGETTSASGAFIFNYVNQESGNIDALRYLLKYGYQDGGTIYVNGSAYYSQLIQSGSNYTPDETSKMQPREGYFYTVKDSNNQDYLGITTKQMFINNNWMATNVGSNDSPEYINPLPQTAAKQIVNLMQYYGSIFSAAFNGRGSYQSNDGSSSATLDHCNITAKIKMDSNGKYYVDSNGVYQNVTNVDKLQDGLKSGVYQLVNISNPSTGGYSRGQNIDYFRSQNQILEKTDNDEREQITAWYQTERAALNEKESYWDSEISDLSTELNTITTEIESVKKLRSKAIESTFKWGEA